MPTKHPILWTNDDIANGQTDVLQRMLDFLKPFEIPGIFFVVPQNSNGPLDEDVELCRLMEKARKDGHEFYQHGYVHTPFESGVPETWMLDFAPTVRARYDAQRLEIEATHTLEKMVEKIEKGQKIWRRATGEDSPGYRPGWGAFCTSLYRALDILGYEWVSSRICSQVSWYWNQENWDAPIEYRDEVPGSPWRIGRLIEYPIGGDYAFRVPNEPDKIQAMADLWLEEFEIYRERDWPMSMVSHGHGLERNEDAGYAVHANALPRLLDTGHAEFITQTELHNRTLAQLAGKPGDRELSELCA